MPALARTGLFDRDADRPRASFSDALAVGGGVVLTAGVALVAFDIAIGDGSDFEGELGALVFLALAIVGFAALLFLPAAMHAAFVATNAISIPAFFGLLLLPETDSFTDVRVFIMLTILGWAACFFIPGARGRPIFVSLAALLSFFWVIGEVSDVDESFSAAPVPSPMYASPGALFDAMRGGTDDAVVPAAFRAQVEVPELDPSSPLYEIAQDCAAGSDKACATIYWNSAPGSDLEAFAEECGGRGPSPECIDSSNVIPLEPDDPSDGDSGDPFGDDLDNGSDDDLIAPVPIAPDGIDTTPTSSGDDGVPIGIVSFLFGGLFLAALRVLDAHDMRYLGTAFVLPAAVALTQGVGALGEAAESAIVGGLLAMAAGFLLGAAGYLGRRRFTAWFGGFLASVGAIVIAGDVSALEDSVDDDSVDLISSGLIVALFGVIVIALAFLVARLQRATGGEGARRRRRNRHRPAHPNPRTRRSARRRIRHRRRPGRHRPGRHRRGLHRPRRNRLNRRRHPRPNGRPIQRVATIAAMSPPISVGFGAT